MGCRIAVVLPCNINWAPYYKRYEELLLQSNTNFDLILWNREQILEDIHPHVISFNLKDTTNNRDWKKFGKFIAFAVFVKKTLKKNKYSKVIFLGTYAGNSILLHYYLKKHYYHNYILDIRDYTYEWFWPFYWMEKSTIYNSYTTIISSYGFRKFLPEYDYLTVHNINKKYIEEAQAVESVHSEQIRISFIGNVRYYKENVKLLEQLKNDNRFIIQFFGAGADVLKEYCSKHAIYNVKFIDKFAMEQTKFFYAETDIINNLYGNEEAEVLTALSNKLYYAIGLKKPILVNNHTYMSEITVSKGFGYIVEEHDTELGDHLYQWYQNFSAAEVEFETIYSDILTEDCIFEDTIKAFINESFDSCS